MKNLERILITIFIICLFGILIIDNFDKIKQIPTLIVDKIPIDNHMENTDLNSTSDKLNPNQ